MIPMAAITVACQATAAASCRWMKPSVSAGQVSPAAADRRGEREAKRDDRPSGQPDSEDDRGRADGAVVHDLQLA